MLHEFWADFLPTVLLYITVLLSCLTCSTSPHPTPSRAPAPPPRRTRTEIVITRAGVLGLRSRLTRSGPGGPAQSLQVSRLHRQASCLTCATSPHPTPSRAPAPPHRRTRTEIVITRAGVLGLRSRLARSGPGGPAQPLQVSRLHRQASCLTCATSPHPTPSRAPAPPYHGHSTSMSKVGPSLPVRKFQFRAFALKTVYLTRGLALRACSPIY